MDSEFLSALSQPVRTGRHLLEPTDVPGFAHHSFGGFALRPIPQISQMASATSRMSHQK